MDIANLVHNPTLIIGGVIVIGLIVVTTIIRRVINLSRRVITYLIAGSTIGGGGLTATELTNITNFFH